MKKILYIGNYMLDDVISQRQNEKVKSQAGFNKMSLVKSALEKNNCQVLILSNGWVNNRSGKFYKGFVSSENHQVRYCSVLDLPILNLMSIIISSFLNLKKIHREGNLDAILFYNFLPETAIPSFLAHFFLKIPIIVDFEEGYNPDSNLSFFKKAIFKHIYQFGVKQIDGAMLVNSFLKKDIQCKTIVVRGIISQDLMQKQKEHRKQEHTKPMIVYAGRLDDISGIQVLLDSLNYSKEDFQLLVCGRGEYASAVADCTDHRVTYCGYLEYEQVQWNLLEADIVVVSQLSNHVFGNLSFPSKLFEYLATKNFIISSAVSDIELCFPNGEIAIYKDDNPEELAKVLDQSIQYIQTNGNKNYNPGMEEFIQAHTEEAIGKLFVSELLSN